MSTLTNEIRDELYRLAAGAVLERNLATAAVLLDEQGFPLVYEASRVASENNALSHADLRVIDRGCEIRKSVSLRGCTLVSVFEPSLMTLSAAYWASITAVYYYVSAEKYLAAIPWASEGISVDEKQNIASRFTEPVILYKQEDIDNKFEQLCDHYIATIIKKS